MRRLPRLFALAAARLTVTVCAALLAGCGGDDAAPPVAVPSAALVVDGDTSDWAALAPLHRDPAGDAAGDALDLRRLWAARTGRYLVLRLELGRPINLQDANDVTLYLDTDAGAATGVPAHGLGAEVMWTFGAREGRLVTADTTATLGHAALGLVTLPTVAASTFEIALDLEAMPDGKTPLADGATLRLAFDTAGDVLPDAGPLTLALPEASGATLPAPTLARDPAAALRVVSFNVERDGLFDLDSQPAFRRLLEATQPDVIGFQEIYDHDAAATRAVLDSLYPAPGGATWQTTKQGLDLVTASRFPIRRAATIPGAEDHASAAVLLDTRAVLGSDLLVINMHPPCCTSDEPPTRDDRRQQVVDRVVAFVRAARAGRGPMPLDATTPLVILGDMNFVGDPQQPATLRTGDIQNEDAYGPDAPLDADGSPLVDLQPPTTGLPMTFTWYAPGSSFGPGRLDYLYVSDSVLRPVGGYALFTPALPADTLAAYGLDADDTTTASDHLPLVVDFAPVQ